jgi:hypothetical protein
MIEIVLAVIIIIVGSLVVAFIEENHRVKKLTGMSLWETWSKQNNDKNDKKRK